MPTDPLTNTLATPRKLEKGDDRSSFSSGAEELDDWFRRFAWENQRANNAVTYVSMLGDLVVGYYSIAAAGISRNDAPSEFAARRPTDIPCVLLARLAVHERGQGRGVGGALLLDAVRRAVAASEGLGAACLLVHCRDQNARSFYLHHADLLQSPIDPMHLVLPMKSAKRLLTS